MTHASLFSGIGGFDLAAQWCRWDNIFQVEIDKFCQKVLAKNFPEVKRYADIREFDGMPYRNAINVLSGGFPYQPFSVAGNRKGKTDDRYLWPEMLRVISEIRPAWVIGENVAGIINMELDQVLADLEAINYETQAFVIPACAVNAPHRRDRVWIVAHNVKNAIDSRDGRRYNGNQGRDECTLQTKRPDSHATDTSPIYVEGCERGSRQEQSWGSYQWSENWIEVATRLCRVDDGISHRVDRLKSLGNAIVPQVAYQIFKAIQL